MAVDNVTVSNSTGIDGNSYTNAVSNDQLTNEDFLNLMLEEMKLQDPTKPMDSASMLDSQMQMSSIETNLSTIEAMKALQTSFSQMALASATDVIGRIVEDGTYSQSGDPKGYMISSVESIDGEIIVKGYETIGYDSENDQLIYSEELTALNYNNIKKIY